MGRKMAIDRPRKLTLNMPANEMARLDLLLVNDLEGRVPLGSYSRFFADAIRHHIDWPRLDLQAYGLPQGFFVHGPREMLEALEGLLQGERT
jgi:hypothetical protein